MYWLVWTIVYMDVCENLVHVHVGFSATMCTYPKPKGNHPIACSGKSIPSKWQSHLGA